MMYLTKASNSELNTYFSSFVSGETEYFFINKDDVEVGVFAVERVFDNKWEGNTCEIGLHIFEDFRFKLPYKEGLKLLLYYPFSLGYDNILISTIKKSVITLLLVCGKLGVYPLGISDNKMWFVIQAEKEG